VNDRKSLSTDKNPRVAGNPRLHHHYSPGTKQKGIFLGARYQIVKEQTTDTLIALGDPWPTI